jgi:catechol 2,3-dioxygenase-like lactoylglutathione lyase family enzyme
MPEPRSMFAYICLGSNNLERSAAFYDATLGVLGYSRCNTSAESETSWNGWLGWGLYENEGAVQDALWVCEPFNGASATVGNGGMVALWAKSWRQVEAFHAEALAVVCRGFTSAQGQ